MPGIFSRLPVAKRPPTAAQQFAGQIPVQQGLAQQGEAEREQSRNKFMDTLGGGQEALNTSTRAAMSEAMPEFQKAMQGVQETEIARGVGLGGLGTSYEGDLESAFERNIANATASQALGLYGAQLGGEESLYRTDTQTAGENQNRFLDVLASQRDYDTAQENAKKKRKAGLLGFLGGAAGGIGGFLLGGIPGAEAGAKIGSTAGGAVGG